MKVNIDRTSVISVCLKGRTLLLCPGPVRPQPIILCTGAVLQCFLESACQWVGCWMQVSFIFGYSMKLQSVVKTMGGMRALTLPFSTPLQNMLVHDLTVKVSIPRPLGLELCPAQLLPFGRQLFPKPHIVETHMLYVAYSTVHMSRKRVEVCHGQVAAFCQVCIQAACCGSVLLIRNLQAHDTGLIWSACMAGGAARRVYRHPGGLTLFSGAVLGKEVFLLGHPGTASAGAEDEECDTRPQRAPGCLLQIHQPLSAAGTASAGACVLCLLLLGDCILAL